jgi:hypothetical protein
VIRRSQASSATPVAALVALLACRAAAQTPTGATSLSGSPAIALGVALSSSGGGNSCAKASSATWTLPNSGTSYYAFYGSTTLSGVTSTSRNYTAGTNAAGFGGVFTVTFVTNQCPPVRLPCASGCAPLT